MRTRAIYGVCGLVLGPQERAFFRDAQPLGFILFARNVSDGAQVRALVTDLRDTVGDARAPVLIDQEGGRVARLIPPHWHERPAAARFGEVYAAAPEAGLEAAYLGARLIAHDLADIGINVDCLPVLDVPVEGADTVIGDRAYAKDPTAIIALGRVAIQGLMEGGVLPVMKHIPGHGRAAADSHLALPRVATDAEQLSTTDFVTFRSLNQCPLAMTAHVVYEAIDPHRPATTSPKIIRDVIRGEIGFDGFLMSDDVSMGALEGPISVRTKAALFAGCDGVLHCNGKLEEMKEVAQEAKVLEGPALKRAEHALGLLTAPDPFDPAGAEARLTELLGSGTMSEALDEFEEFEAAPPGEALVIAVDGFEGPLDLLLTLARAQKVDIAKISILKLADQYLLFIESAKRMNLELAADYLVMAAWLAYLKSRMILPQPEGEDGEPSIDEMASRLRWRLQRLEAMRQAAARLMARDRLGRDVFARGMPEPVNVVKLRSHTDSLFDLLTAYASERVKKLKGKSYKPMLSPVLLIEEARNRLERMLGRIPDWNSLSKLLPFEWSGGQRRRSALASTLLACLELARDGRVEIRQLAAFDEVYIRDRTGEAVP